MVKQGVLMVCLGNICRSPIAEAVFDHVINERGLQDQWFTDSCGTGDWHVGRSPDSRSRSVLKSHRVKCSHQARQLCREDFDRFEFIFGMDKHNVDTIKEMQRKWKKDGCAKVEMLGEYHPNGTTTIHDPYYDSDNKGFEECYEKCLACVNVFLDKNA
jgi:low molecular weight phosphotyrosine protein phosphatase